MKNKIILVGLLIILVFLAGCKQDIDYNSPEYGWASCETWAIGYYNDSGGFVDKPYDYPEGADVLIRVACPYNTHPDNHPDADELYNLEMDEQGNVIYEIIWVNKNNSLAKRED